MDHPRKPVRRADKAAGGEAGPTRTRLLRGCAYRRLPSAGSFSRDLRALLAGFREADGDGLLAAFYRTALAAFAGTKRATLPSAHGARHLLAGALAVLAATFSRCHLCLPLPFRHASTLRGLQRIAKPRARRVLGGAVLRPRDPASGG